MWVSLLEYVDLVTSLLGYEKYDSARLLYIGEQSLAFGPRRIMMLIIDMSIIFFSNKTRTAFRTKTYGFGLLFFVIYTALMPIFIDNMTFSRLIDYFQIGRVMMMAYLLFYLIK